jgi:hypothetical protein
LELAKREGKPRRYIAYNLCFGRFLSFGTTVPNAENNLIKLTEGKFRQYWDRTDKCGGNERQRWPVRVSGAD